MRREITDKERYEVRKAVRAGTETAEEVGKRMGRSAQSIRKIARENGFPFTPRKIQTGKRGPYSLERVKAIRDGVLAAQARKAGVEA